MSETEELLRKWAQVLDIPSGKFVNEDLERAADELAAKDAKIARLKEALAPSAETKGAYIGEFQFAYETIDEDGEPCTIHQSVPWTTIKEIMAAISARAALAEIDSGKPADAGSGGMK